MAYGAYFQYLDKKVQIDEVSMQFDIPGMSLRKNVWDDYLAQNPWHRGPDVLNICWRVAKRRCLVRISCR